MRAAAWFTYLFGEALLIPQSVAFTKRIFAGSSSVYRLDSPLVSVCCNFCASCFSRHAVDGKRQFFGGIFRLLYRSTIELQLNVGTHYLLEVLKLTALDTKLQKRGPFGSLWTLSSLANCIIYQRGITKKDLQNSSNFLAT